jgi:hypothetical protein
MAMDGMSDVERLVALEEIKRLKAMRDYCVDTKDWDTYETLHAPEATSQAEGVAQPWTSVAHMRADISARLDKVTTTHHSHSPIITFESPDEARGIWAMEDMLYWKQGAADHWYHGYGFYHETYVRRDGRWLFASRRLVRTHVTKSEGADLTKATARATKA